jgi:hypothetical protein
MNKAELIIEDIVNSIPKYCQGNQLKTFTYVYYKIAQILEYDDRAAELIDLHLGGYDREQAEDNVINPASTIECLTRGRALCSGYATVLENVLNKVGIPTIIIVSSEIHKWNQVCIDGKWFNCDLTNDRDFIIDGLKCPHFLTSNQDDCNFTLRPPTSEYYDCNQTIDEELQENLINEVRDYFEMQQISLENDVQEKSDISSRFGFIAKIKNEIQSIKGGNKDEIRFKHI